MSRETTPLVSVTRITALLDRLDPHTGGRCAVAGCVHDVAPAWVARGRLRPPRSTPSRAVTARAA